MTHRHAFRRHVTPRPSDKDIRVLRRLLVRAAKTAAKPDADPLPFHRAAEKAGRAILPPGHQGAGSIFVRLIGIGRYNWLALDQGARRARVEEIADLTGQCQDALDEYEGASRRQRADVDG